MTDLGVDPLVGLHFGVGIEVHGVIRRREQLHPGVRRRRLHLCPRCSHCAETEINAVCLLQVYHTSSCVIKRSVTPSALPVRYNHSRNMS